MAIFKDYSAVAKTRGLEVRVCVGGEGLVLPPELLCRVCRARARSLLPPARVDAQGPALSAALESLVLYLALSPWDNEVSDEMHRLKGDARLEAVPAFRALVVQVGQGAAVALAPCMPAASSFSHAADHF